MSELRDKLTEMGCDNVRTLLNTGNFVFEAKQTNIQDLEHKIEGFLSQSFGFPIPVILRTRKEISALVDKNPFVTINVHKDIRFYVSFLKSIPEIELTVSTTNTPKGMDDLEKLFGKCITTRNWNTVKRVIDI